MRLLFRWLRKPLTHFLLIGGSLFLLQAAWQKHFEAPAVFLKKDLVISRNQIQQIKKDVFLQTGLQPSDEQLKRLVQIEIDDEILYREALALKLDQNNPSIRRRLIDLARIAEDSKTASEAVLYRKAIKLELDRHDPVVRRQLIGTMRLIAKKIPTRESPALVDSKAMETYFKAHAALFLKPVQIKFTHLYFSRDKRGVKGETQAQIALQKLLSPGAPAEEPQGKGDVFLGGQSFSWMTPSALERLFGPAFSQALSQVAPGKWAGPLVSSYGWHLVFVEDRRPATLATIAEVAAQIKSGILKEREEQRLSETLQRLRLHYQIIIEGEGDGHA